ncbi:MAG: MXAN_6640 family putative metalloprotease [Candidatus Neomarinimicrobiota bacterium]
MKLRQLQILPVILCSVLLTGKSNSVALNAVINAFSSGAVTDDRHLTPYLLEIAKNGHTYSQTEKDQLKVLGFNFQGRLVNRSLFTRPESIGLNEKHDQGIFRIHFATQGIHAVNALDSDANGLPDYVDNVAAVLDTVANVILSQMGYTAPPGDDWFASGSDNGGSDHYDVYLSKISSNFYGYVMSEDYAQGTGDNEHSTIIKEENSFTSYLIMRNNYSGFKGKEIDNIRVTIAHEFFHSVQFGFDGWQKPWLLEATATWMEEALYDNINDCYQYMPRWFASPQTALDAPGPKQLHWYGSYIFFEYIDSHLGGRKVIKDIFDFSLEKNSLNTNSSIWSINQALVKNNSNFGEALNNMVIANQIMSPLPIDGNYAYEEAFFYNVSPAIMDTVNFQTGFQQSVTGSDLEQFASQYIKVVSATPVQINLTNLSGSMDELHMHSIIKLNDDSYKIYSSPTINIDPLNTKSITMAVVSQDSIREKWSYALSFEDGIPGTNPLGPDEFVLDNPYPNPFNNRLNFSVYMLADNNLSVNVVDLKGRHVALIYKGMLTAGNHVFGWSGKLDNGSAAPSGVYFLVFKGSTTQSWKPITLLK